jgi:hypothetical protein
MEGNRHIVKKEEKLRLGRKIVAPPEQKGND